ncbi:hypothetical protein [Sphingobium cupriresistens]|uniref:hypothetical protein n=1 Tax=Sphingobium cupriresistens TaxID=1132417 RepID=UPI0011E048C2|nr:hypothetical protein [Sphingobium cupriresistens]
MNSAMMMPLVANRTMSFGICNGAFPAAINATSLIGDKATRSSLVGGFSNTASDRSNTDHKAWFTASLDAVSKLDFNWDGYGAEPIPASVVNQMKSLLTKLLPASSGPGSIAPAADGSLQAEWHFREASFGLVVDDDNVPTAWLRVGGVEREQSGLDALTMFSTVARSLLHV